MANTIPNSPWVLSKAILVHAPEFDVGCVARLRISHDQNLKRGFISIRFKANLAGLNSGPRMLMLNIRPETVETCTLALRSNVDLIPSRLFNMAPVPVTDASAISTLTLCLNTTGVVVGPPEATTLSPVNRHDVNFYAFAKICQTKTIHLHFSRQQFVNNDLPQLRAFSRALRAHKLEAEHFDYTRFDAGRGAEEKDWRVFDQSLAPPSYHEAISTDRVLGKRARDHLSSSPDTATRKRLAAPTSPSCSPTVPNTPSTLTPSPSNMHPTNFTHTTPPAKHRSKVLRILRDLKGAPDHLVREILTESGHQHLLTAPHDLDLDPASSSSSITMPAIDALISTRLNHFLDTSVQTVTKEAFKSLTQHRLHSLVEAQLPLAAELVLNNAIGKYRDEFYEGFRSCEVQIREQVDEGKVEVADMVNGCLEEMKEAAQGFCDDIEEHGSRVLGRVEDGVEGVDRAGESGRRRRRCSV